MGHVRPALVSASLIAACLACARSDDAGVRHHRERLIAASHGPGPAADFLISAGDSTFWVTSGANGIRVRGAPLILARVNGRFYELYVADDDRSYYDAVFTGQRIYRRDIERGDSAAVFEDTAVAAAAHAYAVANPKEVPLDSDEDAADNPKTSVTGDIDLLDSYGPYLSFEYHGSRGGQAAEAAEAHDSSGSEWVMRGVIDLVAGRGATVQDVFGRRVGDSLVTLGRHAYSAALDTIRAREALSDDRAKLAVQSLSDFVFEPRSFVLTDVDREPAVAFFVPGRGRQGGRSLGLPPVHVDAPVWWTSEREFLPTTGKATDTGADFWRHPPIVVRARYDTAGAATVTLVDDQRREWAVGALPAPIRRVYWLDDPAVDQAMRRALTRAFDESALYSDDARAARRPVHVRRPVVHYISERR